jgi:putative ABC transport system permease protein
VNHLPILVLALKSLNNRRLTAGLTLLALSVSMMLVLGVEKIRTEAKASFANTISGTDLIVGARSGTIQLLLYSVFRIGDATTNISWKSYRQIAGWKNVAWAVPLSLGDSHRGYRVLGTTGQYFQHYRYGRKFNLAFASGKPFEELFDAVVGAEVAKALGYDVGSEIVVSHGLGRQGFQTHEDKPFRVSGVLAKTGTPVDRTIHISVQAIEAIHLDWKGGSRVPGMALSADDVRKMNLTPKAISAVLVGTKSRFAAFGLLRSINSYPGEPLLAILPGVALQELWGLMGTVETALSAISISVVVAGILGMVTMLLAGLNERRRELAILRSVGARPRHLFTILVAEAATLSVFGAIGGLALLYGALAVAQPILDTHFGLFIEITPPNPRDFFILALMIAAGVVSGVFPAWKACRNALSDGLITRL